jgi:hypothetical protein
MRILRFLFTALVFFAIVGVGGFLGAREILLHWGVSSLEHSLKELQQIATSDRYAAECQRRGGDGGTTLQRGDPVTYQLRFLSSTEYIIEAVCDQFSLSPIVVDRMSLPQFISKSVGGSGFLWQNNASNAVTLTVFGDLEKQIQKLAKIDTGFLVRQKTVAVVNQTISIEPTSAMALSATEGPATTCQGYGYQCCEQSSQMGIGDQLTGTLGCAESCYTSCVSRPTLLSFNSNPFFDIRTRILTIKSGDSVEFLYIADSTDDDNLTADFDFGDGQQEQLFGKQGHISHTYHCPQGGCIYIAKVALEDKWGVHSAHTSINQITVQFAN